MGYSPEVASTWKMFIMHVANGKVKVVSLSFGFRPRIRGVPWRYPPIFNLLVMTNISMENQHVQWKNPL